MSGWTSYDGWKGASPDERDGPGGRACEDIAAGALDKERLGGMDAKDFGSPSWCIAHNVVPVTTTYRGVVLTRYVRRCAEPSCSGTVDDHSRGCPQAEWNK